MIEVSGKTWGITRTIFRSVDLLGRGTTYHRVINAQRRERQYVFKVISGRYDLEDVLAFAHAGRVNVSLRWRKADAERPKISSTRS
jgi:hypothetical protein